MSTSSETEISFNTIDLLHNITGLLYDYLIRPSKHTGRMRFKKLNKVEQHFVAEIPTQDGSMAKVYLKLDQSEFIGTLRFMPFRKFLHHLLGLIAQALENGDKISIRPEENGQRFLLNLPVAMEVNEQLNVLMLGFDFQQANEITIELLFFEPTQFANGLKSLNL